MKTNQFTLDPQTGAERDALSIFLSTVYEAAPEWVHGAITAMGHGGQRVLLQTIQPAAYAALEAMYRDLDAANEDTIGDGLHWRDGESIMNHLTLNALGSVIPSARVTGDSSAVIAVMELGIYTGKIVKVSN